MAKGAGQQKIRAARRMGGRSLRGFRHDASGASALEFAIVAAPLILLLLAVLQLGIVFFANFMLESATARGARLIRTGQAQTQGFDAAKFKQEVCKQLTAPINCSSLKIDVRSYPSFGGAAASMTSPLGSDGKLKSDFSYDPGHAGDVVVVRAFYPLDIGTVLPTEVNLSNMAGGNRLIIATSAFRNEPYE
jgi:Flp pilus assembly protein TadG